MTDRIAMRRVGRHRARFGILLVVAACSVLFFFSPGAEASKSQPAVIGSFSPASSTARVGDRVDLVLHLLALAAAPQVEVRFLLPSQVRAVRGSAPWFGSLAQGETVDLPLTVELTQAGEYSIGAAVKAGARMAGVTLNVLATAQGVALSTEPHFLMKLRQAPTPEERKKLLEGTPSPVAPALPKAPTPGEQKLNRFFLEQFQKRQEGKVTAPPGEFPQQAPTATSVSGVMNYQDTAGTSHPIRYALVQILNGANDLLLAETLTLATGTYAVGVNAESVKVKVFTEDGLRSFVRVYPPTDPTARHAYTSPVTPITGPSTVINLTTDKPTRGTPGAPSADVIQARAFSVFDAFLQSQVQAFGLRGGFLPRANVSFPKDSSHCPSSSCYSIMTQETYILREDALDWDVLDHEFIHFLTDQHQRAGGRVLANNPGGSHSGGSAIGQNGRNRDEGMRLAWAEGFATFLGVRLQSEPASADFGMSWPAIPNVGDTHYQDTEDAEIDDDLENIAHNEGYGSENSIATLLWDLADSLSDSAAPGGPGQATDKFDLSPKILWDLISTNLPCNPCDRVDRFWNAAVAVLGVGQPLLDAAETFALNRIAPELVAPDPGSLVSGGVSPTFEWNANGDPSPAHNPNRFFLVVSKDNFQGDLHLFPTNGTPLQVPEYQIPDADFRALVQGATDSTVFTWLVIGWREADGNVRIPEGSGFWVSNARTFLVRAYHIKLTWDKLGTDVDLHFRPPDGATYEGDGYPNDCTYYNPTPDWGVADDPSDNPSLDRECNGGCTEENITVDKITEPGTYKILVHYYYDSGQGPTTATVEIFQNGNALGTWVQTLAETDALWEVLSFTIAPSGKVVAVSPSNQVTKVTPPANRPRVLQKPRRGK